MNKTVLKHYTFYVHIYECVSKHVYTHLCHSPCSMSRSQMARTVSQRGRLVKRLMNQGGMNMRAHTPRVSWGSMNGHM